MKMKRMNRIFVVATVLIAAFAVSAAIAAFLPGNREGRSQAPSAVKIDNFSFGPETLDVRVGSTVTWTNQDDVPHVVASDDNKLFKSQALDTNDRFSFTFTKPGTYNYYCAVHPRMTATVVVH
jgi:plastocyanin